MSQLQRGAVPGMQSVWCLPEMQASLGIQRPLESRRKRKRSEEKEEQEEDREQSERDEAQQRDFSRL